MKPAFPCLNSCGGPGARQRDDNLSGDLARAHLCGRGQQPCDLQLMTGRAIELCVCVCLCATYAWCASSHWRWDEGVSYQGLSPW